MSTLAVRFAKARLSGGVVNDAGPLTLDEGYAIADSAAGLLGAARGWKVGATNPAGQQFLKVTEPICGRVFGNVVQSGEAVLLPGSRPAEAEPEIFFKLKEASQPGGEPPVIAGAYLGMEINRPSHDEPFVQGVGFIVADNAAHAALVVGPQIALELLDDPAAIAVTLERGGVAVASGEASAVLGNPLAALAWLAGERNLNAGDWIATGAMTRSCPFLPGDTIVADFGPHGFVSARAA